MCAQLRKQRIAVACAAIFVVAFGLAAVPAIAETYKPLFAKSMLEKLDPVTRERFELLESENRRRWRNRNPQAPDLAAAKRQHQDTQAILRRFEESRRLETMADTQVSTRKAVQQKKCKTVAAEIDELSAGGTFYETAPGGEKRYLSDKEVADRVKSQQKSYNKHCKS